MSKSLSPPCKTPFATRREREFLYLSEVDELIAATQNTRTATRNSSLAMLLFTQALQPTEICWLRWCDLNFTANTLLLLRNRSKSVRIQPQVVVNTQPLSRAEINILQELQYLRTTDWLFESERKQRLSERSLHHIIANAGVEASLPMPIHPYMLRRTGLYYRAALLLQALELTLGECCLLWKCYATGITLSKSEEIEYHAIQRKQEEGFLSALEQIKTFTQISAIENVIDYLLGAYSLFPRLQGIPDNYWLAPKNWIP